MKLKLTLEGGGRPAIDLLATVDADTTVGDLAAYLARSDPRRTATGGSAEPSLTLGLVGVDTRALDPRVLIADSALRSGAVVTLSRAGQAFGDPDAGAAAVMTVIDGPDKGKEFGLRRGSNVLGRERGCDVQLSDPLVSRQHARVNVGDVVEIVDLGSANGVGVGGATTSRAVVRPGDTVRIGDTSLTIRVVQSAVHLPGAEGTTVSFIRPPRLEPRFGGEEFEAPNPPDAPARPRFPVIALIAPVLIGAVLYAITKSVTSLAFVALSPLMLIGNSVESRLSGKAAYKKALALWQSDLGDLVTAATAAAEDEVAARNLEHPSLAACTAAARAASSLVWARRPDEPGFCELRLGVGRQPSRSVIKLPDAANRPRDLMAQMRSVTAPFSTVDAVPVVAALGEHGGVGFSGEREALLAVSRGFIAQAAILHSPAELILAGFASTQTADDWDWLKWLPHASSPHSPLPVRQLASTASAATALVSELEDLLSRRDGDDAAASRLPAVLVVVDEDAPVEHSRLVQLAEQGWKVGIHMVWLASDMSRLPAACRTFVELGLASGETAVGFVHSGELVSPIATETLTLEAAVYLARAMSPMADVGARVDDASDLPRSVSLLSLTGTTLATAPESVIERWSENRSIVSGPLAPDPLPRRAGTLRAVVGRSAGEPLALDLRADGPHALVGGTTGSGKSELLQAWILAMAAAHSPQRLTFLLVDYKGGSAFRDCTELPHTIGLVTDLTPHLVRRALTSLKAELRHREHVLAQHAAKDLATLEKQGVRDAPPSLVIVVDEFAALVNEVPEFVDGVVDVAQRGRSLGLHLILATQRPAGVIKDNLRANTNLRLALRMADEADSTDVLGSPEAAFFDQAIPGRAVSKTGPGRLVPFQTAYAGGWTTDAPPPPELVVEELVFGAGRVWEPPLAGEAVVTEEGDTDIKRLVRSVGEASRIAEIAPPRKPWLPELKAIYDLADQTEVRSRRSDTELVFGVRDDPENQAQPTVAFHPDKEGNLAVYGTGGSGKSTLLRTLAIAAGFTVRGGPCHVYGLDFGVRGLSMLESLPHVGSIIDGSDHERLVRLLAWLRSVIDERGVRYSALNASTITDYRRLSGKADEPRILLLVDGVAAFRQAYEPSERVRWFDLFTSLATDGRLVGVHVILSSDQRSGMTTALASAVQSRVVLRLASDEEYGMLNVPSDVLSSRSPAGRALVGDAETQIAVLGGTSDIVDQDRAIKGFAASMIRAGTSPAMPIERLPDKVRAAELPVSPHGPVIGISSSTLAPHVIDPRGTFIVSGPPGSGRTTTLLSLLEALRRWRPDVVLHYFGNRRSPLAGLSIWKQAWLGPDQVAEGAAALASDVAGSTAEDPTHVVVIEGIGEFAGGSGDGPLQELIRACVAADQFAIIEGETSTLAASFGALGAAKSSRAGLALAPDQSDGTTVFRTDFPRTSRPDFPPGRALHVALGRTEVVQIALPDELPG